MSENHKLKCWGIFYDDIVCGRKTFEIRKNDRQFQPGDTITLIEIDETTGAELGKRSDYEIRYTLGGGQFGLEKGYIAMSIRPVAFETGLLHQLKEAVKNMESEPVQGVGEWQRGLFCGLEDRGITDRYESCQYGYNQALDKVQEWIIDGMDQIIAKAEE